jgi:hypothetical protein
MIMRPLRRPPASHTSYNGMDESGVGELTVDSPGISTEWPPETPNLRTYRLTRAKGPDPDRTGRAGGVGLR